jgi:hypothetical protein
VVVYYNASGQLGDGATTDRHAPVQITGVTGMTGVAAGEDHSLAVTKYGASS